MGKASILIVMGVSIIFGIFGVLMSRTSTNAVDNYASYYSKTAARNANLAALELALKKLSDSTKWRTGYPKLTVAGTNVSVRIDSVPGMAGAVLITSKSAYSSDTLRSHYDTLTSAVTVQMGFVPRGIRGAITAFGPVDKMVSDMLIDGRDHEDVILSSGPPVIYKAVPNGGVYAVSTGAPTLVINEEALLGGSDMNTNPRTDYLPSFPPNPNAIETSADWSPGGFPKTPDAALGWPEGTLEAIAKKGLNGSRYITTEGQLQGIVSAKKRLQGVTYFDIPETDLGRFSGKSIPDNSSGIFVYHCKTGTAFWKNISCQTNFQTFKGLMIFDKMFHFHMNLLGALILLDPNTVTDSECAGNRDKTITYSKSIIEQVTGAALGGTKGGWRAKLSIKSWLE